MNRIIVSSMREALLASPQKVHSLNLAKSPDMICSNLMCEKLGDPCVCKLARFLEQNKWPSLEELHLSGNNLTVLPTALFMPSLKILDCSSNQIKSLPQEISQCQNLEVLNISHNLLTSLPFESLRAMPRLSAVHVSGNKEFNMTSLSELSFKIIGI